MRCHLGSSSCVHLFECKHVCVGVLVRITHMGVLTFKCHLKDKRGQITDVVQLCVTPSWRKDSPDPPNKSSKSIRPAQVVCGNTTQKSVSYDPEERFLPTAVLFLGVRVRERVGQIVITY